MSPTLQHQFMTEVAPVLISAVPRVVRPVGSEDADELVQDALAEACRTADSLERRNQPISPSALVFYTLQRLKAGRRSTSAGRTDVMSPGCQLDGRSQMESLDAPVTTGDEGEELSLGDVIAHKRDDPGSRAARNLDWSQFMSGLTSPQQQVVWATATGFGTNAQADLLKVSPPRITQQKRAVAEKATGFWGVTANFRMYRQRHGHGPTLRGSLSDKERPSQARAKPTGAFLSGKTAGAGAMTAVVPFRHVAHTGVTQCCRTWARGRCGQRRGSYGECDPLLGPKVDRTPAPSLRGEA